MEIFKNKRIKDIVVTTGKIGVAATLAYFAADSLGELYDSWLTSQIGESVKDWFDVYFLH